MVSSDAMRLFQRGKRQTFYLELGRGNVHCLHTADRDTALSRMREKLMEDTKNVRFLGEMTSITLSELTQRFLRLSESNKAYATTRRENQILPKFLDFAGHSTPIASLTSNHLEEYKRLRQTQVSPVTLNVELRVVKSLLSWSVKSGLLKVNPFQYVGLVRFQQQHRPVLTEEQVAQLCSKPTNPMHRALVCAYAYTGARRSEIAALRWQDIDLVNGWVSFPHTKTRTARRVPLLPMLREAIAGLPRASERLFPLVIDQVGRIVERYLKECGFEGYRPHDLRHTLASHLISSGAKLPAVSKILGHQQMSTTMNIYAHIINESELQTAMEKLYASV